jgi:triacylglycerol lipase
MHFLLKNRQGEKKIFITLSLRRVHKTRDTMVHSVQPASYPALPPKQISSQSSDQLVEIAKKSFQNRSRIGEFIRGTTFTLMSVSTILGGGLLALIGSPIVLIAKSLQRLHISCTPLEKVANIVTSAAREAFSMLLLTAHLPLDLEKLDPEEGTYKPNETPILLVHGFLGSSSHWLYIRPQLAKTRINLFTVNLGDPRLGIDTYAQIIAQKVKEIKEKTNSNQVILIGHSMGGLVCEKFAESQPESVKKIIAIGSPLKGTHSAYIAAFFSKCAQDMKPNSSFLSTLKTGVPITTIASSLDEVILPNSSAKGSTPQDTIIDDASHVGLLFSEKVISAIKTAIDNTEGQAV